MKNTTQSKTKLALVCLFLSAALALFPTPGNAQELTFTFQVTIDGETSDFHQFGLRVDAMQGIDNYDVPEPPTAPDAAFTSYLGMFEAPTTLPNRWRHDFRPTQSFTSDRVELWPYYLESPAIGSEATISITATGDFLLPYELFFLGSETSHEPITSATSITVPITSGFLVYFWELQLADEVTIDSTTWGGVKNLYR